MGFLWNVFKFFLLLKLFWFCWFIFLFGWRCNWSFNFLNFCCWFYFINFFILSRCCDRGLNFLNFRWRFRFIDFLLLFINSFYKLRSRYCIRTVVLYLFNCSIDFSNNLLFSCIILLNFLSSINPCLIFNIFIADVVTATGAASTAADFPFDSTTGGCSLAAAIFAFTSSLDSP